MIVALPGLFSYLLWVSVEFNTMIIIRYKRIGSNADVQQANNVEARTFNFDSTSRR